MIGQCNNDEVSNTVAVAVVLFSTIRGSGWPGLKMRYSLSSTTGPRRKCYLTPGHPLPRMVLNSSHELQTRRDTDFMTLQ